MRTTKNTTKPTARPTLLCGAAGGVNVTSGVGDNTPGVVTRGVKDDDPGPRAVVGEMGGFVVGAAEVADMVADIVGEALGVAEEGVGGTLAMREAFRVAGAL